MKIKLSLATESMTRTLPKTTQVQRMRSRRAHRFLSNNDSADEHKYPDCKSFGSDYVFFSTIVKSINKKTVLHFYQVVSVSGFCQIQLCFHNGRIRSFMLIIFFSGSESSQSGSEDLGL